MNRRFLRHDGSFVPSVERGKSLFLTFFGAKKEAKKHLTPYFLWRKERSKETSTPSKASPYMGRMQLKIAETDDLSGFWYGSQAFALKGEPWSFIGWRMEKEIDTLIIYTIVKTPGCGAEPQIMALYSLLSLAQRKKQRDIHPLPNHPLYGVS